MSHPKDPLDQEQSASPPPTKRTKWSIVGFLLLCFFQLVLWLGLSGGAVAIGYLASVLQEENVRSRDTIRSMIFQSAQTGFVYFDDGSVIAQLRTEEDRRLITYQEIPKILEDAVLATEDNDFYQHIGVDGSSLARAIRQRLLNEDVQTGGSTITQQLARRVFLSLEKSAERKIKEIFLALRIERFLTKQEIMAAYLNKIPYGNGSSGYNLYGIKAAAKGIFNKGPAQLNIAQVAYLAGLPQQPSTFSAFTSSGSFDAEGFAAAMRRQQIVLSRMLSSGRITQTEYNEAKAFDIRASLSAPEQKGYTIYPFLMMEAERRAAELLLLQRDPTLTVEKLRSPSMSPLIEEARVLLLRGGYHIYTTIDAKTYKLMNAIAQNKELFSETTSKKGMEQVGAMLIDNRTGAIQGLIEGRDFSVEQLNHATQMLRQPGSAMKPIAAYWPALNAGLIQPASILDDVPLSLSDGQKGVHIPMNWDKKFHGLITAREALNQSWNIPALTIFNELVTIPKAWSFVRSAGITSLTEQDNQAQTGVLGGLHYGVSVEELTNAYASIANKGLFADAFFIKKLKDSAGNTVFEHRVQPKRIATPQSSYLLTDMLRTVIRSGTAKEIDRTFRPNKKTIPIAGKTGTTSDNHDVWFIGYTPDITLGVWIGYDQPSPILVASRARKIWVEVMNTLVKEKPDLFKTEAFEKPSDLVYKTVSAVSGLLPNELVLQEKLTVSDWFHRKYVPTKIDDVLVIEKVIQWQNKSYRPQPSTPPEFYQDLRIIKRKKPLHELLSEIEKALKKNPNSSKLSIEQFRPTDGYVDPPSEVDPRQDDGVAPNAPQRVTLTRSGTKITVRFAPNREPDVVGYRLFRSLDTASYERMDRVVLAGADNTFTDDVQRNTDAAYYVVAVDVAGRTSSPSLPVSTGIVPPAVENTVDATEGAGSPDAPPSPQQPPTSNENPITPTSPSTDTSPLTSSGNPTPPTALRVSPSEFGVELMWQPNDTEQQVERYDIYLTRNGDPELIGSTFEPAFLFTNADPNGAYTIRAINAQGESAPSAPVTYTAP